LKSETCITFQARERPAAKRRTLSAQWQTGTRLAIIVPIGILHPGHYGLTHIQHTPETVITANGVEICTDAFGDPQDPTILLITDASAPTLLWQNNSIAALVDGGRFGIS
jgi:hypothetical protein